MKNRLIQKTPKFFRIVRNVGLILTAAGTAIVTLPISVPAIVVTGATYLIAAGTVAAAVSQATITEEPDNKQIKE